MINSWTIEYADLSTQTLVPLIQEPVRTWYWLYPDTLREPFTVREGAPGGDPCVWNMCERVDYRQDASPSCPFPEAWQWFAADLLALSAYGRRLTALTRTEYGTVVKGFTALYANHRALCNGTGFPKTNNYVEREITGEKTRFDKIRRCGTDSVTGEIVRDSKGHAIIRLDSFYLDDNPPTEYGLEILYDPRVAVATNIYPAGVVGNFPPGSLPAYTTIVYPFLTRVPVYYPLEYCERYEGARRPIGYRP